MFCPNCGLASTRGLNYCNRCGSNLSPSGDRFVAPGPAYPRVTAMFWGVALLSVSTIIAMFSSIANYPVAGLPPAYLTAVVVAACAVAFGTVAMLIYLLLRLTGHSKPREAQEYHEAPASRPGAVLTALPPSPRTFGSVTDSTTRNFPNQEAAERQQ